MAGSRLVTYLLAAFLVASILGTVWLMLFDGVETLQWLMGFIDAKAQVARGNALWLFVYGVICIVSQLLVVPSGSLILIAAGFIFTPLVATAIFSVAQILCSWPVYMAGEVISKRFPDRFPQYAARLKVKSDWTKLVQREGLLASIVLRLTPVIPSAAACLLAAGFSIKFRHFIQATIAVCWIRPLFFASIGGSLLVLTSAPDALAAAATGPLLLLFVASILLLLVKYYLGEKI